VNGDGKLSLAEAAGYGDIVVNFHRVDRNKDGRLTKAEFDRLAKLPPPKERKAKPRLREDAAASLAAARREAQ
jgi:histone H3/H4